jgi:hypothetical protein
VAGKTSVWAARPFGYGEDHPMLDVGEVIQIEVGRERNDEKLLRLELLRKVESGQKPVQCGKCERHFLTEGYLNQHGRNHHSASAVAVGRREMPDADLKTAEALGQLRALEAADEFAEKNIPIDYSKTKASQADKSQARGGRRASR